MKTFSKRFLILPVFYFVFQFAYAQAWYDVPAKKETRWASFENQDGETGNGGKQNKGAKGHAFDQIKAGETITLLDMKGAGIINRIWLTINDRSPIMLRSLCLRIYWDGNQKPAVSAPLGDFFGVGLGKCLSFENVLFSDPEGRSFNCYIPMPFKKGARVTITNYSDKDLSSLFFDIDFVKLPNFKKDLLYFHTYWARELKTKLAKDFEIIPYIEGNGRFLGVNIGLIANNDYERTWWGEGEIKMYIDENGKYPTLVSTGTEDYIGTGWGQGVFNHRYQGSLIANQELGTYAFYRYHIPDPIYFQKGIKVTIQQIGGATKAKVIELVDKDVALIPISIASTGKFVKLLEIFPVPDIHSSELPEGWTNFYRQDDISSTAYFYLDKPTSNLPSDAPLSLRTANLISEVTTK